LADHGKFLGKRQKLLDQSFRQIKKAVVYGTLGRQGPEEVRGSFQESEGAGTKS